MNRRVVSATGLLIAAVLLATSYASVAWLSRRGDSTKQPTYEDFLRAKGVAPSEPGVQPRDLDPATAGVRPAPDGGWITGDHSDAIEAAARPADLDQLVLDDREKWLATQQWKLSHGGATPYGIARRRCMLEQASGRLGGQACENEVIVVVHRTSDASGEVVYVRPDLPSDAADGCRDYSECLMRKGWLGRETPLPPGNEPYFAFRAGDVLIPFQGSEEERLVLVRQEVERLRKQIDELAAAGDDMEQLDLLRDLLAFNEWTLEEAEE